MAREIVNPQSVGEIGRRLFLLRKALGRSQVAMGQMLGQASSTWAMYELGERRIHIDEALKLAAMLGCSLDWIYCGNIRSMPVDLAEKIQIQERVEAELERTASRRRS